MTERIRLPNRREQITETVAVGDWLYEVSIGIEQDGRPREIFLAGAKSGADMDAILADTAVVISVALQHDVPPSALARSLSRIRLGIPGLAGNDEVPNVAASVIGAALDLLVRYDSEVRQ